MKSHDWMLVGIGLIPIAFGILTLLGNWIPGLRSYSKNSHKRPKELLSPLATTSAALFLIGVGSLLIWLGFHPA